MFSKYSKWNKYSLMFLLVLFVFFQWFLPKMPYTNTFLIEQILTPFQGFRTAIFNRIPFSLGDILYLILIAIFLFLLVKCFITLKQLKTKKSIFIHQLKTLLSFVLLVLLGFSIFWNGYYARPHLNQQLPNWENRKMNAKDEYELAIFLLDQFKALDTTSLFIDRQENYVAAIQNNILQLFHHPPAIKIKRSIFATFLPTLGIQGYYNPLTGEAQYNPDVPVFLKPFLMAHEYAHVLGVAAEGEANFVAYYICTQVNTTAALKYSAYFQAFLYNQSRLRVLDSTKAQEIKAQVPAFVKQDLQELKNYYLQHPAFMNDWIDPIFDRFLKINGENQGVESYGLLTRYVYLLELEHKERAKIIIRPYQD